MISLSCSLLISFSGSYTGSVFDFSIITPPPVEQTFASTQAQLNDNGSGLPAFFVALSSVSAAAFLLRKLV